MPAPKQRAMSGKRFWLALPVALAASVFCAQSQAALAQPVVVELFQSQGCSSCPPANANLNALADRPDVLALSFGVTYWDKLGWKDTFATPQGTARQWDYAHGALHAANVYTPQVVINGRRAIVGVDRKQFERAIAEAAPLNAAPSLALSARAVSIGAASTVKGQADVWLVRYDPRVIPVAIRRGENGGKTLPHKNIVRQLVRLGGWSGGAQQYELPVQGDPRWRVAIIVQGKNGGAIIAALKS
jgi:hypothetical protein